MEWSIRRRVRNPALVASITVVGALTVLAGCSESSPVGESRKREIGSPEAAAAVPAPDTLVSADGSERKFQPLSRRSAFIVKPTPPIEVTFESVDGDPLDVATGGKAAGGHPPAPGLSKPLLAKAGQPLSIAVVVSTPLVSDSITVEFNESPDLQVYSPADQAWLAPKPMQRLARQVQLTPVYGGRQRLTGVVNVVVDGQAVSRPFSYRFEASGPARPAAAAKAAPERDANGELVVVLRDESGTR